MQPINLVAQHLDESKLIHQIHKVDCQCSFTGLPIKRGVSNKDLIKKTFTDNAFLRYSSGYSSVEAALCIESVIPSGDRFNSLRNYSFLATNEELILLNRENILDLIREGLPTPFVLCVTYSNKKHTAYKAKVNYSNSEFTITTDIGDVFVEQKKINDILPIIQRWYTIVKGKEETSEQPTNFTKQDILTGCDNPNKINNYGVDKYFKENKILERYRNTAFLNFLVHILNKNKQ